MYNRNIAKEMTMNQTEAVLAHLQKHKSITSWEAIQEYGATRLSDIIYRLRDRGYDIQNIWKKPQTDLAHQQDMFAMF